MSVHPAYVGYGRRADTRNKKLNTMQKNNFSVAALQQTIKLNLRKNLKPVYSRLLNKNIDLAKVNSETKFVQSNVNQQKSLKLRVLDITKLNRKINILSSIDRFNKVDIISNNSNVGDKAVLVETGLGLTKRSTALSQSNPSAQPQILNILVGVREAENKIKKGKTQKQSVHIGNKKQGEALRSIKEFKISKYLQTISNFETEIAQFQNIVYNFNNNKKKFKINSILENSFYTMKSLIGTPVYEITPNNITINLFYYLKKRYYQMNLKQTKFNNKKFFNKNLSKAAFGQNFKKFKLRLNYLKSLIFFLSKKINKPINLDLTRLSHPTLDSKISANAIGIITNKLKKKFLPISFKFFESAKIKNPTIIKNIIFSGNRNSNTLAVVSGINLKKGGRLMTQSIVPKLTSKIIQIGSINRANTDFVTTSRYTAKNKRGAFSITVTMGHKFF
jgi:hypothetical protein